MPCSGPGTAVLTEVENIRLSDLVAAAVAEFGEDIHLTAMTDDDLYAAMLALTHALATRSCQDRDGDRRTLDKVVTELERRGYQID